MALDRVIIVPLGERSPEGVPTPPTNAEISLEFSSYTVTEGLTLNVKILRTVRTDQVLDVDWAAINVNVFPVSGTERFQVGETEKIVQVTAQQVDSGEQGTFELSNPQYVSGPFSDPILVSPSVASVTLYDLNSLAESSTNLFLDPSNGDDGWNGLYASYKGGSNGPKRTWSGIKALNLNSYTGIYMRAGTITTQESFYNQSDFVGSSTNWKTISAYYLSAGVPYLGIGNDARPIMQGTSYWQGYDGSNQPALNTLWPPPNANAENYGFMIGYSLGGDCFWDVSYIHVRHLGSRGIGMENSRGFKVHDCWIEKTLGHAVLFNKALTGGALEAYDNVCLGICQGRDWYGFSDHPASITLGRTDFTNEPEPVKFQRNIVGLSMGEGISGINGAINMLIEDNTVFDNTRLKYYADECENAVFRRNLGFQTGKTSANKASNLRRHDMFSIQGGEPYMYPPSGSLDPDIRNTRDLMFYANVSIANRIFSVFWDTHRDFTGTGENDMETVWIFRNTVINVGQGLDEFDNDWTVSDGRLSDNQFFAYNDGVHSFDQGVNNGTWVNENNAFSHIGTIGALEQSWINNLNASWNGDTTGWDSLHTLTTGWTSDYGLSMQDAIDLVASVKNKVTLGTPSGDCVGGGRAWSTPPSIIDKSFENVDFFQNVYVSNDVGAIAS